MAKRSGGKKPNLTNKQLRWLHSQLDKGNVPAARAKKLKAEGKLGKAVKIRPEAEEPKKTQKRERKPKVDAQAQLQAQKERFDATPPPDPQGLRFRKQMQAGGIKQDHIEMLRAQPETVDLAQTLQSYRSFRYLGINGALRGDEYEAAQPKNLERAQQIRQGFADHGMPLADDLRVYRGVKGEFAQQLTAMRDAGTLVGTTLEDQGFLSTSAYRGSARTFQDHRNPVMFDILAPKGKKTFFLSESEYEFLFDAGSRVRIHNVRDERGTMIVEAAFEE